MKILKVLGMLAALLAAAPATSSAEWAYTAKDVNLRAGPGREFPVVAVLPGGISLYVEGCVSDYRWCDVSADLDRGWVYAGNIVYPYEGMDVPVLTYGARIGLGIVYFSIGPYWDDHYRARSWYSQRQRWIDRPRSSYRPGVHPPAVHPPGVRPGDRRPPQAPGSRPGDHRPPQIRPPEGSPRPPLGHAPGTGQRPPQDRRPHDGERPTREQGPGGR